MCGPSDLRIPSWRKSQRPHESPADNSRATPPPPPPPERWLLSHPRSLKAFCGLEVWAGAVWTRSGEQMPPGIKSNQWEGIVGKCSTWYLRGPRGDQGAPWSLTKLHRPFSLPGLTFLTPPLVLLGPPSKRLSSLKPVVSPAFGSIQTTAPTNWSIISKSLKPYPLCMCSPRKGQGLERCRQKASFGPFKSQFPASN